MTSRFEANANGCSSPVAALALLIALSIPVSVRAQPVAHVDLVDLDWQAPQGCPDASTVLARVRALAGATPHPSLPLTASVKVRQRKSGRYQLQLVVEKDGLVGRRELEAASCEDLAGAVAVNLALLFEDSAALEAAATTAASQSTQTDAPPPSQRAQPEPTADPPSDPPFIRALLQGPLLSLSSGPLPELGASAGGGVALESWRIAAGATVWLKQKAESDRPETGAELLRITARALGCRGISVGQANLAPCLSVSLEHVRAQGYGAYVRRASAEATWLAVGAGLQARFPLTPWLNVLGGVELKVRTARPRVSIEGVGEISRLGWIAAELSLGSEWIL